MTPQADTPLISTGQVAIVLLSAAFLSVPVSAILLSVYRRAILSAMRQVSLEAAPADDVFGFAATARAAPVGPARTVELDVVGPRDLPALTSDSTAVLRQALRGPWINTWRFTLSQLAATADAVLMDLRGFSPANQGCVFELHELLHRVPLQRVVLLVDSTTNRAFLGEVLQQAGEQIPPESPNSGVGPLRVLACDLTHEGPENVRLVLQSLARAVSAPAPAFQEVPA